MVTVRVIGARYSGSVSRPQDRCIGGRDLFAPGADPGRGLGCKIIETAGVATMLTRRCLIALSAAQVVAPSVLLRLGYAQNADYPNKPVRLIVPVAAGGPTDIVARMLGDKLSKMWGQQVVVENKG